MALSSAYKDTGRRFALAALLAAVLAVMQPSICSAEDVQVVPKETLRTMTVETLSGYFEKGKEIKFYEIHLPEEVKLPTGKFSCAVDPGKGVDGSGRFSLKMSFSVDGTVRKALWVWGRVGTAQKMVVAARPIKKSQVITGADLGLAELESSDFGSDVLTDPGDAVGLVAVNPIRAGASIKAGQLKPLTIIKRGQLVRIIAASGGLKVTAVGTAKEDGAIGGDIKVENVSSRRLVLGRVVSEGLVEVSF